MPDRPMKPSRLLARLDAEIASAVTQVAADCKQAERAGYLARMGRIDDAKAVVAALHQRYDQRPHIEVSVWTHLVEGLIGHFSDMDPGARQKIQRAHALSTAAGLKPLRALSAAWLATMEYARLDVDAMCAQLAIALTFADLQHHAARARVALVIAQAMHLARRADLARIWYQRSRHHTLPDGDDATTSALMHGSAWLHMALLRQSALAGVASVHGSEYALVGAESNKRFDDISGISSLPELEPILRAQIHSLQQNFGLASHLYEAHLAAMQFRGALRLQSNLLADRAWCRLQIGMLAGAEEDAYGAIRGLIDETQIDERAATHSRLAQVFNGLGKSTEACQQAELAQSSWAAFANLQAHIVTSVSAVSTLWDSGHQVEC